MSTRFIVVDDDPLNNRLCNYNIAKVFTGNQINCFQFPSEGLKFISSEYSDENNQMPTILFLDINMPVISGWDFLDEFEKMSDHIHRQFTIYIVSSSIDPADKKKAEANIFVKGFLSKPLNAAILKGLV